MLLEHARQELKLAGYNIDREIPSPFKTDDDYSDACAKNVYEMLEVFSKAGHSGFSANVTLRLFNRLANFENLTPLTNDISEWKDVSEYEDKPAGTKFQSKRKYSCFSNDGLKTYYDLDENEDRFIDEDGCGYTQAKPKDQWVYHELPNKENK
mgnify:CR=1 FL=1